MVKIQLLSVVLLFGFNWQVCGDKTIQPCGPQLCEEFCKRYKCSAKTFDAIQLSCQLTLPASTYGRCHVSHEGNTGKQVVSKRQPMQKTKYLTQQDGDCPKMQLRTFFNACNMENFSEAKRMLDQGLLDVNCRMKRGRTLVMHVAYRNWLKVFDFAVQCQCDLEARCHRNRTVLHYAAEGGAYNIVKKLVDDLSFDIESKDNMGGTPIMIATFCNRVSVLELLVDRGANVKAVDIYNNTILHLACLGGGVNTIKYVLSLNITDIESKGIHGNTPLLCAVGSGKISALNLLLKHNASLNTLNNLKQNALHLACQSESLYMVKFLLSLKKTRGIEAMKNIDGFSPFLYCRT